MESFDLRLKSPFTAIIAGPTASGKTHLLRSLIANVNDVCDHPPEEVIYCYGVWQKMFESIDGVTFHEGMIDVKERIPRDGIHRWLVIDDLMDETNSQTDELYTKYSHHLNVSVFFVVQNFFRKQQRTMSLNTHYLFLFKNPRDSSFISHLARQIYPNNSKFMIESFQDATRKPFSYLLVDLKQNTDEKLRLIGEFSSEDETKVAYLPKT
jgi:energy-coupling factor transporter ATP-binding protein EcfA2